jgi:hypothetical protein
MKPKKGKRKEIIIIINKIDILFFIRELFPQKKEIGSVACTQALLASEFLVLTR